MAQLFFDVFHTQISFRVKHQAPEFNWDNWVKIALATPPQEFDLPLAEGFSNAYDAYPSKYSKTQESIVTVVANLKADTLSTGTVAAILPAGFRPAYNISFVAKFGSYKTGAINVYANGNISINGPFQEGDTQIIFACSFIAAT